MSDPYVTPEELRERHRARGRVYAAAHRAEKRAYDHARYIANPERSRTYRLAHLEEQRAYDAARYREKPENTRPRSVPGSPERAARRATARAYRAAHPEQELAKQVRRFGLTLETYMAMLGAQGGVCAICRRPETSTDPRWGTVRRLSIDHDHSCCPERARSCGDCVRGLLCRDCNTALGKLGDNAATVGAAALYLGWESAA